MTVLVVFGTMSCGDGGDADDADDADDAGDAGDVGDGAEAEPTGRCSEWYPLEGEHYDGQCRGNTGCTDLGVTCGECACTLCWNQTCFNVVCDDGFGECEVPLSDCGELAVGCGFPSFIGDPEVCDTPCASDASTCADLWACDSGPFEDDAAACESTCEGCWQGPDCEELCAAEGACVLEATSCQGVADCE
jgi:hypothetical protein